MTPETDKNEDEAFMETHSDKEVSLTVEEVKTLLDQEHNKEVPIPQESETSNPLVLEQEVSKQMVKAFSPTRAVTQSIKSQLQAILTSDVFMGTLESSMKKIAITTVQEQLPKKIEKDKESLSPAVTDEKRPMKSKTGSFEEVNGIADTDKKKQKNTSLMSENDFNKPVGSRCVEQKPMLKGAQVLVVGVHYNEEVPIEILKNKLIDKDYELLAIQKQKWDDQNLLNRYLMVANMARLNDITILFHPYNKKGGMAIKWGSDGLGEYVRTFCDRIVNDIIDDENAKISRGDFGFDPYFLLVTDNASHFANALMEELTRSISFEQSFNIAYEPWTNGAVEITNSGILKHMRALISQYSLRETQWPSLIPLLNHIVNNKPSDRREVDKILDVRLRGHKDQDWRQNLYNALPELVLKYLEVTEILKPEKRVIYNRILKWEPGPKTKKLRNIIKVNAVKMKNPRAVFPKYTLGWYAEEKEVLEALIKKLGCGNYEVYLISGVLPRRNKVTRDLIEVEVLEVTQSRKKLVLHYNGGNVFELPETGHRIYMDPPMAKPVLCNVFDLNFNSPKKKQNRFQIVLMDPLWGAGTRHPMRDVALEYPTIPLKKFKSLNFPPELLVQPSFLFIWVTNRSFFDTVSWAQEKGYALVDEIVWIKRHNSGSLTGSLGQYLQHAQETCLLFRSLSKSGYFKDMFQEICKFQGSSTIVANPQMNSFKPLELYTLIEDTWPHMNYLELFGTHKNLRPKWTTVGLDLTPHFLLNYLTYDREDWKAPL
eukprot:augustus_masked-scaffold_45-processed-gene-0.0-mRNA-1 protein AED:1.00 eAED:1.00 QI:0/0/0/0/1/1/10/0/767